MFYGVILFPALIGFILNGANGILSGVFVSIFLLLFVEILRNTSG